MVSFARPETLRSDTSPFWAVYGAAGPLCGHRLGCCLHRAKSNVRHPGRCRLAPFPTAVARRSRWCRLPALKPCAATPARFDLQGSRAALWPSPGLLLPAPGPSRAADTGCYYSSYALVAIRWARVSGAPTWPFPWCLCVSTRLVACRESLRSSDQPSLPPLQPLQATEKI